MPKMSLSELKAMLAAEKADALAAVSASTLSHERADAMEAVSLQIACIWPVLSGKAARKTNIRTCNRLYFIAIGSETGPVWSVVVSC